VQTEQYAAIVPEDCATWVDPSGRLRWSPDTWNDRQIFSNSGWTASPFGRRRAKPSDTCTSDRDGDDFNPVARADADEPDRYRSGRAERCALSGPDPAHGRNAFNPMHRARGRAFTRRRVPPLPADRSRAAARHGDLPR